MYNFKLSIPLVLYPVSIINLFENVKYFHPRKSKKKDIHIHTHTLYQNTFSFSFLQWPYIKISEEKYYRNDFSWEELFYFFKTAEVGGWHKGPVGKFMPGHCPTEERRPGDYLSKKQWGQDMLLKVLSGFSMTSHTL